MSRVLIPLIITQHPGANKLAKTPVRGCKWAEPEFEATPEQWSHSNGAAIRLDGLTVLDIDDPDEAPPGFMDAYHALDTVKRETPRGWHAYFEGESTPNAFGLFNEDGTKFADVLSTSARYAAYQGTFHGHDLYPKHGDCDTMLPLEELRPLVLPFAVKSPTADARDPEGGIARPRPMGPFVDQNRNNSLIGLYGYLAGAGYPIDDAKHIIRCANEHSSVVGGLPDQGCRNQHECHAAGHTAATCELANTIFNTSHDEWFT